MTMPGAQRLTVPSTAGGWPIVGVERRAVMEPVIGADRWGPTITGTLAVQPEPVSRRVMPDPR